MLIITANNKSSNFHLENILLSNFNVKIIGKKLKTQLFDILQSRLTQFPTLIIEVYIFTTTT